MTLEKAQKDFMELIEKNGFTEAAKTTDTQNTVYHREWTREVEVAWHGKEKAIDHPLYLLLHDEPNPEMSSFVFRETLMTHLLLWGNAYAQIIRNGKGEVIALYPLMPNKMTVDRDEKGQLYYTYQRSNDEAATMKGSTVTLKPSDVLHIPGLGFDGLVGYSPIAMAKNAIGMAIACEEYGAKFFANGAAPGGVLEHPGTIKDPQRVRESWQSTFGGSGNANKIAVLEEGMKYKVQKIIARKTDWEKFSKAEKLAVKNAIALAQLLHRMCAVQLVLDAPKADAIERVNTPVVDRMIADANNVRDQVKKGIAA